MQKNDQFTVTITDYTSEGLGLGKADGFAWFIKDTVIGDTVLAQATKVKKNYGFARLVKVLNESPNRVKPACPIAGPCGGCQLQHLSYEAQLTYKSTKVYNNLLRIGEVSPDVLDAAFEEIVGMKQPFHYRNKAQYPIARDKDGRLIAGFYAGHTHHVVPAEHCLLGVPENQAILHTILHWMDEFHIEPYNELNGTGLVRHVLLRKGFTSGQSMVCLVINGEKLPHQDVLIQRLTAGIPYTDTTDETASNPSQDSLKTRKTIHIDSISYSVNRERTNVIMGTKIVNLYGPGYIEDSIGDIRFRISPLSFFQVNPVQTKKMYDSALEFANLQGHENVWDLYCGIGTISLFLSQKAKKVYGVEIIPEAIRDARDNASLNGIRNAEFFTGAAEEILPKWYEAHPKERIDVVCVDPPRKGCDEKALETILKIAPEKLVYVSCDSATLARDVKYLSAHGYTLKHVRPIDNFCNTVHCEVVTLLTRDDSLS